MCSRTGSPLVSTDLEPLVIGGLASCYVFFGCVIAPVTGARGAFLRPARVVTRLNHSACLMPPDPTDRYLLTHDAIAALLSATRRAREGEFAGGL